MASAKSVARTYRAHLINDGATVTVEAPPFHVWNDGGVHELVCFSNDDAIARMRVGISRCTDRQCDWCADNRILRIVN